jgi:hypothetical protein
VCNTEWIFRMHGATIKINAHVTYVCVCWFYYISLSIGYSFFISHLFRFLIHLQWRFWFSKHAFCFITGVFHAPSNRKHIYSPVTISYNVSFQTVVYNTLCPRVLAAAIRLFTSAYPATHIPSVSCRKADFRAVTGFPFQICYLTKVFFFYLGPVSLSSGSTSALRLILQM